MHDMNTFESRLIWAYHMLTENCNILHSLSTFPPSSRLSLAKMIVHVVFKLIWPITSNFAQILWSFTAWGIFIVAVWWNKCPSVLQYENKGKKMGSLVSNYIWKNSKNLCATYFADMLLVGSELLKASRSF